MDRFGTIAARLVLIVSLTLASLGLPPVSAAAAAEDETCFPETGFCLSGRFRQFWEQHGSLAVFGFPLSPARMEQNRDTGQEHLTQWFERTRFELHTENAPPYDVLLGRLGDERLLQLGRNWQVERRVETPMEGCLAFATGHTLCDQAPGQGFLTYWLTHGLADPARDAWEQAEALLGQPVSEAQSERGLDGQERLVQWFERARLEWHPTNPASYQVLLGRLGAEVQAHRTAPEPRVLGLRPGTATVRLRLENPSAEWTFHVPVDGLEGATAGTEIQALDLTAPPAAEAIATLAPGRGVDLTYRLGAPLAPTTRSVRFVLTGLTATRPDHPGHRLVRPLVWTETVIPERVIDVQLMAPSPGTVDVVALGFDADEPVSAWLIGPQEQVLRLDGGQANGHGVLTLALTLPPNLAPGRWRLVVRGATSGAEGVATIEVAPRAIAAQYGD